MMKFIALSISQYDDEKYKSLVKRKIYTFNVLIIIQISRVRAHTLIPSSLPNDEDHKHIPEKRGIIWNFKKLNVSIK